LETKDDITQLLKACRQNNQKAQRLVYQRYAKAMYNTALRIVGDADDAQDVMQEAFIKAFGKLHTYKATATFGAWLKRIVINESLTWLRKQKDFECIDDNLTRIEPETEIEIIDNKLKVEQLLEAIDQLKINYKVAINLHFLEGYDYEEMMQILNLSYANVRTLVSRAKQKLKSILETNYKEVIKS